jgi:hypothetical protein
MRKFGKVGATATLSAGILAVMVAAAPAAYAATPTQPASALAGESSSASGSVLTGRDYRQGYREGYRDGFRDGRNACGHRSYSEGRRDRDRGYVDGYNAGFSAGQRQCRWHR